MASLMLIGHWQDTQPAVDPKVQALATLLFYILILLVVFLFGTYAIMRASRRYAQSLVQQRRQPTDAGDVWSMHTLPEEGERDEPTAPDDNDSVGGNGAGSRGS